MAAKHKLRGQQGFIGLKHRSVYYEDLYGRPDKDEDKDDVQKYSFDMCESSSGSDDNGDYEQGSNDKGSNGIVQAMLPAHVSSEALGDESSIYEHSLPYYAEDTAPLHKLQTASNQSLFKISPGNNPTHSIERTRPENETRDRIPVQHLGMFAGIPLHVDAGALKLAERSVHISTEQHRTISGSKPFTSTREGRAGKLERRNVSLQIEFDTLEQPERRAQNHIEHHQALPPTKRTGSSKQGRSQRIRVRRAMTEKARRVRARLVCRRDMTGMTEMREGETRLAGNREKVMQKPRSRALSPYVVIDIDEVMGAVRYRDGGRKARAGSPFVLVESD